MDNVHEEVVNVNGVDYVVSWQGDDRRRAHVNRHVHVPRAISRSPDLISQCQTAAGSGLAVNSAGCGGSVDLLRVSVSSVDRNNPAAFSVAIEKVAEACERINIALQEIGADG